MKNFLCGTAWRHGVFGAVAFAILTTAAAAPVVVTPGRSAGYMYFPPASTSSGTTTTTDTTAARAYPAFPVKCGQSGTTLTLPTGATGSEFIIVGGGGGGSTSSGGPSSPQTASGGAGYFMTGSCSASSFTVSVGAGGAVATVGGNTVLTCGTQVYTVAGGAGATSSTRGGHGSSGGSVLGGTFSDLSPPTAGYASPGGWFGENGSDLRVAAGANGTSGYSDPLHNSHRPGRGNGQSVNTFPNPIFPTNSVDYGMGAGGGGTATGTAGGYCVRYLK